MFEYILSKELMEPMEKLVEIGLVDEAITMLFVYFNKNKNFYKQAFQTQGQNCFEETFTRLLVEFLDKIFAPYQEQIDQIDELKIFQRQSILQYYSMVTVYVVKAWVQSKESDK